MKIAIIGGGISGLTAGYRLHEHFDVTLFESNNYIGGHTNTIDLETDEWPVSRSIQASSFLMTGRTLILLRC